MATPISGGLARIPQQASSTNECGGLRGVVDSIRRPNKCLSENVFAGFGFGIKLRFTVQPYTEANRQTQSYEKQPSYTARMRAGRPGASTIAAEVIFRSHADIHPRSKVHAAVKHDHDIIGCVWQRQRPMQFHSLPTLVRRQKFHLLPLLTILHSNAHLEQRRDALPVRSHLMLFYKAVRATTKMISWHGVVASCATCHRNQRVHVPGHRHGHAATVAFTEE